MHGNIIVKFKLLLFHYYCVRYQLRTNVKLLFESTQSFFYPILSTFASISGKFVSADLAYVTILHTWVFGRTDGIIDNKFIISFTHHIYFSNLDL